MSSTYSSNLGTNLMGTGDQSGTWGNTTNFNLGTLMEQAIASYVTQQFASADITLSIANGADAGGNTTPGTIYTAGTTSTPVSARNMYIECQGTSSGNNLIVPTNAKLYFVYNNISSGGGAITVKTASGTGVAVPVGQRVALVCNGTNIVPAINYLTGTGVFSSITNSSLTSGRVVYSTTGGLETDSANLTFNGTTLTASNISTGGSLTLSGGTANGVAYLNGSKVLTTGSALTYNGTGLGIGVSSATQLLNLSGSGTSSLQIASTDSGGKNLLLSVSSSLVNINELNGNPIAFGIGNSEQMRLNSTGLGIGTSSPSAKLHVDAGSLAPTSGPVARFDTSATTSYSASGFVGGQLRLNYGNATSSYGGINFSNFGATSQEFFGVVQNSSGYGDFVWQGFNGSYSELMRLDSFGNFGLGVTPSAWSQGKAIELGSSGYGLWYGSGSPSSTYVMNNVYYNSGFKYGGNGQAAYYYQYQGQHVWSYAANNSSGAGAAASFTQAMTLDNSGNLLVGTTSASARLTVVANSGVSAPAAYISGWGYGIGDGLKMVTTATIPSGSATVQSFYYNSTLVGSITTTGSLTAYNVSSDQRLKTNIVDAPEGNVDAIKVRSFDWISDGSHQTYGMVAQELLEVAPYAVSKPENPEEMMGVDYSKLVPMLIKEIQSLRARVAQLEAKGS